MKWPYKPLADWCTEAAQEPNERCHITDVGYVQKATGCDRGTAYRWRKQGWLTDQAADRVACALGVHPCLIWPNWFDIDIEEAA